MVKAYADYCVTEKGLRYLEGMYSSVSRFTGKEMDKFLLLKDIDEGSYSFKSDKDIKMLKDLLRLNYIKRDTTTTEQLIGTLPPDLRRILDVYNRIAKGELVSDSEISGLHRLLRDRLTSREGQRRAEDLYGDRCGISSSTRSSLVGARTRSEKVIAIDQAMSEMHTDLYYVPVVAADEDFASEEELDTVVSKVSRILGKLANE